MTKTYVVMLIFVCLACRQKIFLGREAAERQLNEALENPNQIVRQGKLLIANEVDATTIAEIYLFSVYGKDKINSQRPFETYLINHYWVMNGTLPLGTDGGNFELVLDAETGEVMRLVHSR